MTRFRIRHDTHYRYSTDVSLSHQVVRVEPRHTAKQRVISARTIVLPTPAEEMVWQDGFGNHQRTLMIGTPHRELQVKADSIVEIEPAVSPDDLQSPPFEIVAEGITTGHQAFVAEAAEWAYPSHYTPIDQEIEAFAQQSFQAGRPILNAVLALNKRIFDEFSFDSDATTIDTRPAQVLADRRGVCQDFTHLMLACLRALHLPSRYVSGYLLTRPPEGREKMIGADASHAWVSVWVPQMGWVDFDPTNGIMPMDEHITLGWGLDYGDVAPVAGVVFGGGDQILKVAVDVSVEQPI